MSDAPSDRLRETYERRAEVEYAEPLARPDELADRKFARMHELLRECLPVASFLDAGCGDGRYLAALGRAGQVPPIVVGIDIAERMLATARETSLRDGVEAVFVRANLEELPFPDDTFELVLCVQVVEHLLEPSAGLREIARVLRPGGTVLLSTDNEKNRITQVLNYPRNLIVRALHIGGRRCKVSFPHRAFTTAEIASLVTAAMLNVERVGTFRFHLDPPFDRRGTRRFFGRIDRALPRHEWGDLIAVVAHKRSELAQD